MADFHTNFLTAIEYLFCLALYVISYLDLMDQVNWFWELYLPDYLKSKCYLHRKSDCFIEEL